MSKHTMTRQNPDEGANMMSSTRSARRAVKGAIVTGTLSGAMLFGAAIASAEPLPPPRRRRRAPPPNWRA